MFPKWLLIVETAALGTLLVFTLPVWALIPMFFGVGEKTPAAKARPVWVCLLAFPVVAIGCMAIAWTSESGRLRDAMMIVPLLHLGLLYAVRVRP